MSTLSKITDWIDSLPPEELGDIAFFIPHSLWNCFLKQCGFSRELAMPYYLSGIPVYRLPDWMEGKEIQIANLRILNADQQVNHRKKELIEQIDR